MSTENSPSRRWQQMHKFFPIYTKDGVILGPRPYPGMDETKIKIQALDNDPDASERARNMEKNILAAAREEIERIKENKVTQASSESDLALESSKSSK